MQKLKIILKELVNKMRESFIFYRSFYESLKNLKDKDRLKLYDAICNLALNNEEKNDFSGIVESIFVLIKPQIEANNTRYINGKQGGRPKKEKTNGFENDGENKKPMVLKKDENKKTEIKPNENVNENENVNVNENENKKENKKEKEIKKKYGEFKNVLLSDNEYQKLASDFENVDVLINFLDEYIEMKGYKAKSHYLAIRRWVVNAVKEEKIRNEKIEESKNKKTFNPFLEM